MDSPLLHRLQLRHLHCFLAVARLGNLRRAAESLAVTQPAVTKTLAELEDILGVALFVRSRRGAALTPQGHEFLRHANTVVSLLGEAVDSISGSRARPALRVGALPTLAASFLPRVLQGLQPLGAVQVSTGRNRELLDRLQHGELDIVIGRLAEPEQMVGLSFEHLFSEPLVVVVHPAHPLAATRPVEAAALGRYPLVLPLGGTLIRHAADSLLATHGIQPHSGVVETLAVSLGRRLCLESQAAWFTPLSAVAPDLADGLLHRLPLATGTHEPVGLALRTDQTPPPPLQALVAAVRRAARQMAPVHDD
ncbi:pca operon transcription factor PcaQ [Caldimonas thermodepolymerans]|jgi:pca operon transcription factor PcaQ|uniref:LysR family transcriptional regulator n=1 Tax=Caldimonas thermodepolymerans TaxID=215580 RepID=A0AA46DEY0_9BURK|nr:pca operon transcription factor PcaQ [Caldimonas thermodepolymerans]RDH95893.1 LysR family transcriptional regulator [Caldimonas thermodepolymerans]TCP08256.1 LysR family transcriptional regulator [Caldimonas thermodepolymerans]UZG48630.1 pca operon transcription factor PcaQ [Caldimonas thermodepolymerans]